MKLNLMRIKHKECNQKRNCFAEELSVTRKQLYMGDRANKSESDPAWNTMLIRSDDFSTDKGKHFCCSWGCRFSDLTSPSNLIEVGGSAQVGTEKNQDGRFDLTSHRLNLGVVLKQCASTRTRLGKPKK